jgi:hypothetical protein
MNRDIARRIIVLLFLSLVITSAVGCSAITGIFKAGVWVGVIIAVIVIGGAVVLYSRLSG